MEYSASVTPFFLQMLGDLGSQLLWLDEKHALILRYEGVADYDQVIGHVRTPDIECSRDSSKAARIKQPAPAPQLVID